MSTHNIHLKYRTPKRYPTIISIVPPGVALIVTFRGSNYRCLEQIFVVPKGFEPSKFDCIGMVVILFSSVEPFEQTVNISLTEGSIWNLVKIGHVVSEKMFKDYMILNMYVAKGQGPGDNILIVTNKFTTLIMQISAINL